MCCTFRTTFVSLNYMCVPLNCMCVFNVSLLLYVCARRPPATIYVSSCQATSRPPGPCVLILLDMCPHTTRYVSSYYKICVLILLCMCPHATMHVSSYCYVCVLVCPHTTICVLIQLHVSSYYYTCPHTTISVSSYYSICVLIPLNI